MYRAYTAIYIYSSVYSWQNLTMMRVISAMVWPLGDKIYVRGLNRRKKGHTCLTAGGLSIIVLL